MVPGEAKQVPADKEDAVALRHVAKKSKKLDDSDPVLTNRCYSIYPT